MTLEIIPVYVENEIKPGDDLTELLLDSNPGSNLHDGDILVFTQKIISKQEGRIANLSNVKPTLLAIGYSQ
ncbi:coenzyme F420-0:L-glutamate ligase [Candidatus Nitrosotalea sp. TS]|uniref:coenzyme F420-0:L-glutamate ligase n=1 Tax=Candidatus Nitrosotalea sp. TS TaxID=2341020 RepID=UPI00210778D1|nr:coenzyme F420-0:L-glutamate ligase [Candidatus Nitrosotalea sp. TS]